MPERLVKLLDNLEKVERRGQLSLNNNDFLMPPEAVVEKGLEAVRTYFRDLFSERVRIERHDVKALIIGQEGAGKTR